MKQNFYLILIYISLLSFVLILIRTLYKKNKRREFVCSRNYLIKKLDQNFEFQNDINIYNNEKNKKLHKQFLPHVYQENDIKQIKDKRKLHLSYKILSYFLKIKSQKTLLKRNLEKSKIENSKRNIISNKKIEEVSTLKDKEIILVLHVTPHSGTLLNGEKLFQSVLQTGFQFGKMNIFHRHINLTGSGPVLFSLVNMIEPGSFNPNNISEFTTPGISIFMTVPSYGDSYFNFKLMLQSAQCIADDCGGIVLDENYCMVTPQKLSDYKIRIHKAINNNFKTKDHK